MAAPIKNDPYNLFQELALLINSRKLDILGIEIEMECESPDFDKNCNIIKRNYEQTVKIEITCRHIK